MPTSNTRSKLERQLEAELPLFVNAQTMFQVAVADQVGVPVNDLYCLQLIISGIADTPTGLARHMGITTGAMTKMLDRMERERLVRREADPDDRRRLLVRPLSLRDKEFNALYSPMGRFLKQQMGLLNDSQLRALLRFIRSSRDACTEQTQRLRSRGRRAG
jgi:DNA-binding MarR family transcriptional regulator